MKFAYYVYSTQTQRDRRVGEILDSFIRKGVEIYDIADGLREGTSMLLSFGGDGTFLGAVRTCAQAGVPVLGINFGRVGFLSEANPDRVVDTVMEGSYSVEECSVIEVKSAALPQNLWPFAVNEVSFNRGTARMMGIDVKIDSVPLPSYWADGLLVSTSAGSTAYSLSAGGPICMPSLKAFLIVPVAPHNLNVRPLVVPDGSRIEICPRETSGEWMLSVDNQSVKLNGAASFTLCRASFCMKKVRLSSDSYIRALQEKLFWGEDLRNKNNR